MNMLMQIMYDRNLQNLVSTPISPIPLKRTIATAIDTYWASGCLIKSNLERTPRRIMAIQPPIIDAKANLNIAGGKDVASFSSTSILARYSNNSSRSNVSGHRRRLVRRTVERLVQLIHFAWPRRLSPENWCLGVENSVFFGFWGYFGVFLVIFGRETGTFSHFLA